MPELAGKARLSDYGRLFRMYSGSYVFVHVPVHTSTKHSRLPQHYLSL